jgi:hypothetical protein
MPADNAVGSSTCYVSSCTHGDWVTIGYTLPCGRCDRTVSRPYDTMLDAGWMLNQLARVRVMNRTQSTNAATSTSSTSAMDSN